MNSKTIAIFHPEGNICSNPNLFGLVEILVENNYKVDIYSKKDVRINQDLVMENVCLILEDFSNPEYFENVYKKKNNGNYQFVFGIDLGIIEASFIAKKSNIPFALISYEIYFGDEVGLEKKQNEIVACEDICFAIVQDEIRGKLLSEENDIPYSKLFFIPVCGRGEMKERIVKNKWHDYFNIPYNKKIALTIGSYSSANKWTMIDELIDCMEKVDDSIHLVIHTRYNSSETFDNELQCKINNSDRIHISNIFLNSKDIEEALFSADYGIAFYKKMENNIYNDKNIVNIGMSSGKINIFLKHGVPIIINQITPMADYVEMNKIGSVSYDNTCLHKAFDLEKLSSVNLLDIKNFVSEYLNLDVLFRPVLELINKKINEPIIYKFNNQIFDNYFEFFLADSTISQAQKIEKFSETTLYIKYLEDTIQVYKISKAQKLNNFFNKLKNKIS